MASAVQTAEVQSAARPDFHVVGDLYLADPEFLWVAPLALALLLWARARRGRVRGRAAQVGGFEAPKSWRQRLGFVPPVCAALALALVCAALARPLRANVLETSVSEGVDIALAIDRSGSMRFPDMDEEATRLDVVVEVVADFVKRRTGDREGAADSLALVTFARYPELLCPFTLDGEALTGFLEAVDYAQVEQEDGTAIGRALAKAVALLRQTDAVSKVVVLLTDGRNNVEDITPREAAELAAEEGIRVYTILAGRYQYQYDPFRGGWVPTRSELDPAELVEIAALTDGRFYRARDRAALEEVYEEIEALEKTERREETHTETFDLYPWLLLPALLFYLAAWTSASTWARRLP